MKIIIESKVRKEFTIGDWYEVYSEDFLEQEDKLNAILSEMECLDEQEIDDLDDADKIDILEDKSSVVTTTTDIISINIIETK